MTLIAGMTGNVNRVLDIFSGIGGFSYGLEKTGHFETVAFCEIEPYCQDVLRKHWPCVPVFPDIKLLTRDMLEMFDIRPTVITGGFPCQDISSAGKRKGIEGERSGLWKELHRIIREVRPRYAVVENVAALRSRGLSVVLADLAEIGYDAEWHCIPASAIGAPHRRDRIWIIAYDVKQRCDWRQSSTQERGWNIFESEPSPDGKSGLMADAEGTESSSIWPESSWLSCRLANQSWWSIEPDVGRVADGVPARVHRLRALGNSIIPQIAEMIGNVIIDDN